MKLAITSLDVRRQRLALRATDALSIHSPDEAAHPNDAQAAHAFMRAARLNAVANWSADKLSGMVSNLEDELVKELRRHAPVTADELPSLFLQFDRITRSAFERMAREAEDDMVAVHDAAFEQGARAMKHHFRAEPGSSAGGDREALVLGAPLSDHFDKMASDALFRLKAAVRQGVADELSQADLEKRITGESAAVKSSGMFEDMKVTAATPKFGCLMAMLPSLDSTLPNWAADNLKADTLVEDGIEMEPHATVLYGFGLGFDAERLRAVLDSSKAIKLKLAKLSRFECDDYDVIKFTVDSPELVALNKKLVKEFADDVTLSKWSYKPHVTVAYVKKGSNQKLDASALEGKTITVTQLLYSLPERLGRKVFNLGSAAKAHDCAAHDVIHAVAPPADVLLRLFDTTDNSIAKVMKQAVTAFASAADQSLIDAAPEDAPKRMGFIWTSAQDGNVCPTCEFYDGNKYDEDWNPVDDAPEIQAMPGEVHWGCRCAGIPCDLDGEVPEGGFDEYLDQFSDAEQRAAFGDDAIERYRKGDIGPGALMNQSDHGMSIEQFKKGEPELRFDLSKYERMGEESAAEANRRTMERRLHAKDMSVRAGDVPGHEFHGNQYTDAAAAASAETDKATALSQKALGRKSHREAMKAHKIAALFHVDAGIASDTAEGKSHHVEMAKTHMNFAAHHRQMIEADKKIAKEERDAS